MGEGRQENWGQEDGGGVGRKIGGGKIGGRVGRKMGGEVEPSWLTEVLGGC